MTRYFGQLVPERTLFQKTRELVIQERIKLREKKLTTQDQIAQEHKLSVNSAPLEQDGMLAGNAIVLKNYGTSEERRNFTFFHELTHHLINNNDDLLSLIHDAAGQPDDVIERLCDVGASEFLVPSAEVIEFVEQHGFTTNAIPLLCERYRASGPAVAFQMALYARHDCSLVIASPRPCKANHAQPNFNEMPLKTRQWSLYTTYTAKSPSAKYSVARDTQVPSAHLMTMAFTEQCRLTGVADIPFRSGTKMPTDCDCLYFRGSVYAFFNRTSPSGPGQLQLL